MMKEILEYLKQYKNAGNCFHREAMEKAIEAVEKQIQTEKLAGNALQIIGHYGIKKQLIKLSEELGELQTEVARIILKMEGVEARGSYRKFCEELADVLLLAEEFLSCSSDDADVVWHTMNFKALRTLERIQEEKCTK